ncbi:eCIS core domain-containing protein [Solwaraspora sp. WMMB335]|uniref:eCIS core domain-containing protein n=1 Tax=Solwaraspora sp. WMMB335 TaxID=3404118 RepID=UPI003B92CB32
MGRPASREPEPVGSVADAGGGVGAAADPAVERAVARARGGGRTVPRRVRDRMEQATGAHLGPVRLHVDAEADRLNDALGSRGVHAAATVAVRRCDARRRHVGRGAGKLVRQRQRLRPRQTEPPGAADQPGMGRQPGHPFLRRLRT